jgi:hypothetical protein
LYVCVVKVPGVREIKHFISFDMLEFLKEISEPSLQRLNDEKSNG